MTTEKRHSWETTTPEELRRYAADAHSNAVELTEDAKNLRGVDFSRAVSQAQGMLNISHTLLLRADMLERCPMPGDSDK